MRAPFARALKWAALVVCCAAPVAATTWNHLDSQGHLGMAIGVTAWIAAIMPIDAAIRLRRSEEASRRLMIGTGILIAIEVIGALVSPPVFLLILFWPVVKAVALLELIPNNSPSDFVPAFVLTVLCGAQSLGCAYLLGKLSGRRSRRSSPAPSAWTTQ